MSAAMPLSEPHCWCVIISGGRAGGTSAKSARQGRPGRWRMIQKVLLLAVFYTYTHTHGLSLSLSLDSSGEIDKFWS
jgi:hypothetical protein